MFKVLEASHHLLKTHLAEQELSVDMTCGNGNDTLLLSQYSKTVYSFDIQEIAIQNAKKLLEKKKKENVIFILDSHEHVDTYLREEIAVATYNLGYLPNGDKSICTTYDSTITSFQKLLPLLKVGGIVTFVIYPGHKPGLEEAVRLEETLKKLPQQYFEVLKYEFINQINFPPYLLAVKKIKLFT